MLIPFDQVSTDALQGLIEEFVTRDGTDYGSIEKTLDEKVSVVMNLLKNGRVVIAFDELSETANLMAKEDYQALQQSLTD